MSEDVIYGSSEEKDDKDELDHLVHLIISKPQRQFFDRKQNHVKITRTELTGNTKEKNDKEDVFRRLNNKKILEL